MGGYFVGDAGAGVIAAAWRLWRWVVLWADATRWGFFLTGADLPVTVAGAAGAVAGAGVVAARTGAASMPAHSREPSNRLMVV